MSPIRQAARGLLLGALTAALLTGLLLGAAVIDSRMQATVAGREGRLSLTWTADGVAGTLFGVGYELRYAELLPIAF